MSEQTCDIFDEEIGCLLSSNDVAKKLKLDVKTVRKYRALLGGIRVGRAWKFPERKIVDALLQQRPTMLDRSNQNREPEKEKDGFPNQERCHKMGDGSKGRNRKPADPHGIFV